jgi:hypothetical protein
MEIMSRVITLQEVDGDPEVLFINTEQSFNIFKFDEVCFSKVSSPDSISQEQKQMNDEEIHQKRLQRLKIVNYNEKQFKTVKTDVEKALEANENISLVLIDSLGSFYYSEGHKALHSERRPLTKEQLMKSYLQQFESVAYRFGVTVVYTSSLDLVAKRDDITTHFISIENNKKNQFLLKVMTKDTEKLQSITIDRCGIKFENIVKADPEISEEF